MVVRGFWCSWRWGLWTIWIFFNYDSGSLKKCHQDFHRFAKFKCDCDAFFAWSGCPIVLKSICSCLIQQSTVPKISLRVSHWGKWLSIPYLIPQSRVRKNYQHEYEWLSLVFSVFTLSYQFDLFSTLRPVPLISWMVGGIDVFNFTF